VIRQSGFSSPTVVAQAMVQAATSAEGRQRGKARLPDSHRFGGTGQPSAYDTIDHACVCVSKEYRSLKLTTPTAESVCARSTCDGWDADKFRVLSETTVKTSISTSFSSQYLVDDVSSSQRSWSMRRRDGAANRPRTTGHACPYRRNPRTAES
jgi:hypothetical protein